MKKTFTGVNGVNLERLADTITAVNAQPALAKFQFRLSNEWINGGHNKSEIKGFYGVGKEDETRNRPFVYANDEPYVLLGQDNAPNPVEFILHALAGCLTTSLVYHAAARGYQLTKVNCVLEGDIDLCGFLGLNSSVRNGYKEVRVKFDIEGNFPDELKEELLQLGPAFSPVFDILTNAVPVKVSLFSPIAKARLNYS